MRARLVQAGVALQIDSRLPRVDRLIAEACGPALQVGVDDPDADVRLLIDARTDPFRGVGWQPLTRDAYHRSDQVLLVNACGSGFDLRFTVEPSHESERVAVDARYRPPVKERAAARALASRFQLLARAVLLQYPALWFAGTRGFAPLHAAAVRTRAGTALLAGPGGVGRSTLLMAALHAGAVACADNMCVSDGQTTYGLVEPVRIAGAGGRRMPHGRRECTLPARVDSLVPDRLVIIGRRTDGIAQTQPVSAEHATRVLVAGTYAAGELRRYWSFAATLALGTGRGPAHPPVAAVAASLAQLSGIEITLGAPPPPPLHELLVMPAAVPA